jgi:hypothetical protein
VRLVRVLAADEDVSGSGQLADAPARGLPPGQSPRPGSGLRDRLLLGYDPVLADMLDGLGARLSRTWSPFELRAGRGHGH